MCPANIFFMKNMFLYSSPSEIKIKKYGSVYDRFSILKMSAVIMKNLASAMTAEHHCLKWCSRARAVTRFFIITVDVIGEIINQ